MVFIFGFECQQFLNGLQKPDKCGLGDSKPKRLLEQGQDANENSDFSYWVGIS
jgi:hypothetical protein